MNTKVLSIQAETYPWEDPELQGFVVIMVLYLLFVLRIGPAYMKNRQPYKLTTTLLVYNFVQVAASIYLAIDALQEILYFGFLPRKCNMAIEENWNMMNANNRLYFIAKVSELLDTIFFVLRKKDNQISFLHIYHHADMVFAWTFIKNHPSHLDSFLRCINSFVHVVMYAYYGLAALGPHVAKYLKWKKYITAMQLIQFVALILYSIAITKVSECQISYPQIIFVTGNVVFMLILFGNFYNENYIKKSETKFDGYLSACMLQTKDHKEE